MTESGAYKLIARGLLTRRANGRRDPKAQREVARNPQEPGRRFTPPDRDHEWVGTEEAAELIGITTQAVAKRCRKGTIPAVRVANKWWLRAGHVRIAANARAADGPEAVALALDGIA